MEGFISYGRNIGALKRDKADIKHNVNVEKNHSGQSGRRNQFTNYSDAQLQKMLAVEYKDISDDDLENMVNNINNMSNSKKNKMFKPLKYGELNSTEDEVQNIQAELDLRCEIADRKSRAKGGSRSIS